MSMTKNENNSLSSDIHCMTQPLHKEEVAFEDFSHKSSVNMILIDICYQNCIKAT